MGTFSTEEALQLQRAKGTLLSSHYPQVNRPHLKPPSHQPLDPPPPPPASLSPPFLPAEDAELALRVVNQVGETKQTGPHISTILGNAISAHAQTPAPNELAANSSAPRRFRSRAPVRAAVLPHSTSNRFLGGISTEFALRPEKHRHALTAKRFKKPTSAGFSRERSACDCKVMRNVNMYLGRAPRALPPAPHRQLSHLTKETARAYS